MATRYGDGPYGVGVYPYPVEYRITVGPPRVLSVGPPRGSDVTAGPARPSTVRPGR